MLALLLLPLLWGGSLQKYPEDQLQESLTVQEGLCALVPCSFYPWAAWSPLYISWFREGDRKPVATDNPFRTQKEETRGRFHLLGNFRAGNCSLRISDARMADTGRYFFQVEIGTSVQRTYGDKLLHLQVTALTEKPTIHVPESLKSGQPAILRCSLPGSCGGGQRLTFSWEGDALWWLDSRTLRSSMLNLTTTPQDHGTSLTCRVKLEGAEVTTERTVHLNVTYAPRNVTISVCFRNATVLKVPQNISSLYILEGQALRLLCAADSNPPAELSWFWGAPALNATPISSNASLELPQVGPEEEGGLTCEARNPLGSRNVSLSLSVLYPPRLLGPSCSWEAQGLRCSCSSRARPAPSLRWRLGERLLEGNSSDSFTVTSSSAGPWANGSLSLRGPLSSDLRLSCEARNAHGAQSLAVLLLPGKPESRTGVVPAALAGAGATALLSLCLCLLFFCIVKACRKGAAGRPTAMDDEDPVMGTVAWGSRKKSWPDTPPDQVSPAGGAPPSGEQQELHYASFTFHGMKMRESQATEYSEVKASK